MRLSGGLPGELGSPLEGGGPQGPTSPRIGVQEHKGPGNGLGIGAAVGHGLSPDLRQAQLAGGENGGPTGHGFEHRQAEALANGRVGQDLTAGQESG